MDDFMKPLWIILILSLLAGCSTRKQTELLEARLRDQQEMMTQLSEQLERSKNELSIARQESQDLRSQLIASGKPVLQPEQSAVLYRLAGVQVDELQSAILPASSGDHKILNLVLTPLDQYRQPLKIPFDVTLEISASEEIVETLNITSKDLADNWSTGWITSGYVLQLPIETRKLLSPQIRISVTCNTLDGRQFEDTIKLEGLSLHSSDVPDPIEPVSFEEPSSEILQEAQKSAILPNVRIDTSDRRTIDEFPVYR
ncbi:MAG: hypothetical protein CMN21_06615 [Rubinisphaera sp.]|nr:hypothetical protein [Rubinisphaera sp.]